MLQSAKKLIAYKRSTSSCKTISIYRPEAGEARVRLFAVSTLKLAYVLRQAQKEAFSVCKVFFYLCTTCRRFFCSQPKNPFLPPFCKARKKTGLRRHSHVCAHVRASGTATHVMDGRGRGRAGLQAGNYMHPF